ncbi:MAG: MBL fold metallo-hydrolase [Spirochaetes bacterium]|nr:MBL fold metallo-hydrolase [Spirochaetota bacterium]
MELTVIAEASTNLQKQFYGWGLSFLIDSDILFDTFSHSKILLKNMKKLKISIQQIRHIVLSHDHWDHTDGILDLLPLLKECTIYICKDFSLETKKKLKSDNVKLVEVDQPIEIKKNVFTSGQIKCKYKGKPLAEQALVINTSNKHHNIVTGCAHPGIIKMLQEIEFHFPDRIDMVFGGLHLNELRKEEIAILFSDLFKDFKIKKIAPCHCTGKTALHFLHKHYTDQFLVVKAMQNYQI